MIDKSNKTEEYHEKIEEMLVRSEQKFHHIFNVVLSGILILDKQGSFVDVNPSACQIFHLTKGELLGRKLTDFLKAEAKLNIDKKFLQAIKTKKNQKGEFHLFLSHGISRDIDYTLIPNLVNENHLYILQDITQQKTEERRQEYYLGILGHELKTPLAGIKAFAQITQRRLRLGDQRKVDYYLTRIDSQVDKLTKFVNELLDVTRLHAKKLNIDEEVFNFNDLVKEIIDNFKQPAKGYEIVTKNNANKNIIADRNRIGEVIINLISNAIKYSNGIPRLIVKSNSDCKNITFNIQDFGIGIPKEKQSKIFEPFFRAGNSREEKLAGLGLGLYISSEIIKLHGGRMWVESKSGEGSIFYFTLPIRRNKIVNKK